MHVQRWVVLVACSVLLSHIAEAKNLGSIPAKGSEQGTVMLNDDLSTLDFCKGPIAFTTDSRQQAPVGCWRKVPNGVRIFWATKTEAFVPDGDIKWLGTPPAEMRP